MKNLLILLLLLPFGALAQSGLILSPQSEISIITCGPGHEELYSAFGHSAIRVFDPAQEVDLAFNYGVFDFNQPNFYLNFARGYLNYKLGVHDYQAFEYHYISEQRYVHEQILNLTLGQKQKMLDFLLWNAQPENEGYFYDYFYDNCATKVPAVVVKVLGDSVRFDGSYIREKRTIRQLTDLYLGPHPWGDLGIDICLGMPMDKVASPYEHMFLPDYVESGFAHATIARKGTQEPLVKKSIVKSGPVAAAPHRTFFHPVFVLSAVALSILLVTIFDARKRRIRVWVDVILFGSVGLIGLLLFCLWFMTDHDAAAKNLNLLWALPTHAVVIFFLRRKTRWLQIYFMISFVIIAVAVVFWPLLPQQLNTYLLPILLALATRTFANAILRRRITTVVA